MTFVPSIARFNSIAKYSHGRLHRTRCQCASRYYYLANLHFMGPPSTHSSVCGGTGHNKTTCMVFVVWLISGLRGTLLLSQGYTDIKHRPFPRKLQIFID